MSYWPKFFVGILPFFAFTAFVTPVYSFTAQEAAQESNRLGINVYQELTGKAQSQGKNILVSPLSLSAALNLAMVGAKGETLEELKSVLASQANSLEESVEGSSKLLQKLNYREEGIELSLANSLWARSGFPLRPEYVTTLKEQFKAEAATLDFSSPQAAPTINQWVAQQTRDKIKEIVEPGYLASLVMTLINATYFKADWKVPFVTANTVPKTFHLLNGKTKETLFMHQTNHAHTYKYKKDEEFEIVELPYIKRASMLILLPRENVSLEEAEKNLQQKLTEILETFSQTPPKRGEITLPKFTFENGHQLKNTLQNLGLSTIFSNNADFSGISDLGLAISDVIQKTYIAVNEKGTEAAAVTAIGIRVTSLPPPPEFKMVVDRPFLFVIKDNATNTILFLGRVAEPQ